MSLPDSFKAAGDLFRIAPSRQAASITASATAAASAASKGTTAVLKGAGSVVGLSYGSQPSLSLQDIAPPVVEGELVIVMVGAKNLAAANGHGKASDPYAKVIVETAGGKVEPGWTHITEKVTNNLSPDWPIQRMAFPKVTDNLHKVTIEIWCATLHCPSAASQPSRCSARALPLNPKAILSLLCLSTLILT